MSGFEKFADTEPIAAHRFAAGSTVVATRDEKPVGFAVVQRIDATAYLTNISVVPESSGENVGTSLLEKAEQTAVRMGFSRIALATFKEPQWERTLVSAARLFTHATGTHRPRLAAPCDVSRHVKPRDPLERPVGT
jgi:GNAT superfamily N-acetyltransferase